MIDPNDLPARFRKPRLNPPEASEYLAEVHGLKVATATLGKWRSVGGGPAFTKFSAAVLYPRDALDTWAAEKVSAPKRSTSDAA